MNYYFETNALYQINKIPINKIEQSYTSILSLCELVSGITESNFEKRKNILKNIFDSSIHIDLVMPYEKIFRSFDVSSEYEFTEKRVVPLLKLIYKVLKVKDYQGFYNSNEYSNKNYGFQYFKELDENWSRKFISTTDKGNKTTRHLIDIQENKFKFQSKQYNINHRTRLANFLNSEKELDESITIMSLVKIIKNNAPDLSEQEIYDSYNGKISSYVTGFSNYSSNKMIKHETPAKNDFSDLAHLLYLTPSTIIVSNDRLFSIIMPKMTNKIEDLLKNT